ncbi:MAG: aminotransferase class I/II-fold pyridoxal phosphate-dependent enzyme [Bryobacteraceae bacterium]|nr:aminotransferase class I/II-fold pyridoxal phosphate-dependent enzyme [Bryobacteraceae bacterium]MDW8377253.1 GntG family PLP-dependent aldolase [Bryobacterales bacterium]
MIIDLRSDTVTKPTAEMRRAMAEAEVGDDVYQEDPTVNQLEQRAAEIFGKQDALFVPTGTMGNTIGIKIHTEHGQEVICEARSHVFNYELAMMAWFTGCLARPIATEHGQMRWEQIRHEIRSLSPHWAPTGLIALENTHNMGGGTVYPIEWINEICDGAHERKLKVHMDGARVFNAAVALGKPVREICAKVDSVMFCLSKGLGAPVGSLLVGSKQDIARARLYRKRLGGGMRQAGVLAAAGLIALEIMPSRLEEDHAHARLLAEGLAELPGVKVDLSSVQTNIVIFDVSATGRSAAELSAEFKAQGVLINPISETHLRIVTHYDVNRDGCNKALSVIRKVVAPVMA